MNTRTAISLPPFLAFPGSSPGTTEAQVKIPPLACASLYVGPCQKCIGGQVFYDWGVNKCLQCGAEHDQLGQWIKPRLEARPKYDCEGRRFNR